MTFGKEKCEKSLILKINILFFYEIHLLLSCTKVIYTFDVMKIDIVNNVF